MFGVVPEDYLETTCNNETDIVNQNDPLPDSNFQDTVANPHQDSTIETVEQEMDGNSQEEKTDKTDMIQEEGDKNRDDKRPDGKQNEPNQELPSELLQEKDVNNQEQTNNVNKNDEENEDENEQDKENEQTSNTNIENTIARTQTDQTQQEIEGSDEIINDSGESSGHRETTSSDKPIEESPVESDSPSSKPQSKTTESLFDSEDDSEDETDSDRTIFDTSAFPKGPRKKKSLSTIHQTVKENLREFVKFRAQEMATRPNFCVKALKDLLDDTVDRPELIELSKAKDVKTSITETVGQPNYHIYYAPSTSSIRDNDSAKNLLMTLFDRTEHSTLKKVFADKDTQSLSLMYHVARNREIHHECISTIIFTHVNEPNETEPFMFVYYRGTNRTPLSERERNDIYYQKHKYPMDNLGIGHLLYRLAQQLLCENDDKLNAYQTYLVSTDAVYKDHYSNYDCKHVIFNNEKRIYTNVPIELRKCLIIENFKVATLKLLVFTNPLREDKICYRRKLARNYKIRAQHVNKNLIELEEKTTKTVIERDYKSNIDPISSDHAQQIYNEYQQMSLENINPFKHLVPHIQSGAKLDLNNIVDKYHNLISVGNMDNSDDENEMDDIPQLDMSYVDKLMLNQFQLKVNFDGARRNRTIAKCEKGNIFCKLCNSNILSQDAPFTLLETFGANIMHYHLSRDQHAIGFTSERSWEDFDGVDKFDKKQNIRQCQPRDNRRITKLLFRAINLDCGHTEETLLAASTKSIGFIQCVLKLFYSDQDYLYVQYLKKSARQYTKCIERIQGHLRQTYKKKKIKISDDLNNLMQEYSSLSSKRYVNRSYAKRQQDIVKSITSNPKPIKGGMKPYRGHDMSIYHASKERSAIRDFLVNKNLKTNWESIELVNTVERDIEANPLTELSEKCKKEKKYIHWLGRYNENGQKKYFLVSKHMIPDDYETKEGLLFKPKFFENLEYNKEIKIPVTIRNKLKNAIEFYENSVIQKIKLFVNKKTDKKTWWGQTVKGVLIKNYITAAWLKDNFKEFYPRFYEKTLEQKDKWHEVPVGARDNDVGNLPKIEEASYVSIYLPGTHKCAFANLANALYAICDNKAAQFFEDNMDTDYEVLIDLLTYKVGDQEMNQFKLATQLLQNRFGYQIEKLRVDDNLLKPLPFNKIKYVTLMPTPNGYKHVIAIVNNKIYDCENQKVLTLCKVNVAWSGSQVIDFLDSKQQTIIDGYNLIPSKKRKNKNLKKRQHTQMFAQTVKNEPTIKKNIADKEHPKVELSEDVTIYLPNASNRAFANLANALYSISDLESAEFFHSHMDSEYKTLLKILKIKSMKKVESHFKLASALLSQFGYQVNKLQINDNIIEPISKDKIKLVTLMPNSDGYRYVIAISDNKIFDCENKKVLKLCAENIAWCGSQEKKNYGSEDQTIVIGYVMQSSTNRNNKVSKRKHHSKEDNVEDGTKNKKLKA